MEGPLLANLIKLASLVASQTFSLTLQAPEKLKGQGKPSIRSASSEKKRQKAEWWAGFGATTPLTNIVVEFEGYY